MSTNSSYGYAWVSMVTSGPSLVGLLLFSTILIHIIINKLRDILDLYFAVLLYAVSQASYGGLLNSQQHYASFSTISLHLSFFPIFLL